MDVEIDPEPTPEEREAILKALELERTQDGEQTPWQRVELDQAGAPPRHNRGATRA